MKTQVPASNPPPNGRPFIQVNAAMSADGKIATANRLLSSFGSRADRRHLLELRAGADAVMCGAATINDHPVTLGPGPTHFRNLRRRRGLSEYNLRIIVSGTGSVNPDARVFHHHFSPILILTTNRIPRARLRRLLQVADLVRICGTEEINFPETLRWLRNEWSISRLVCEGGGILNDALFRCGAVDELHLTLCPFIFGGSLAPTLSDGIGIPHLPNARHLILRGRRRVGAELFLRYQVMSASNQ
ncbi:MAG TPA: dihydrofolate reductase family protein [Methylomirabilota bacterium]|nr:dihydrofolate reductase family protein [Methylomirabilota bacterium]